ncbi:MAG TPA: hypothetical protein VMV77_04520 [Bacteroidales bacterium]|nr:hypothetical protein [Bacteroidales bacterium]
MSTAHVEISRDLINGIFTVLDGNVTYSGTTYPVYKSIPKVPASIYVWITEVMYDENGTKDSFIYYGTVQVRVVDESLQRADKKKGLGILGIVRGLLKPARSTVFSIGDTLTLIALKPGPYNEMTEQSDNILKMSFIDIYDFLIQ